MDVLEVRSSQLTQNATYKTCFPHSYYRSRLNCGGMSDISPPLTRSFDFVPNERSLPLEMGESGPGRLQCEYRTLGGKQSKNLNERVITFFLSLHLKRKDTALVDQ